MQPDPAPVSRRMSLRVRISHESIASVNSAAVTRRQEQTTLSEPIARESGQRVDAIGMTASWTKGQPGVGPIRERHIERKPRLPLREFCN